MTEATIFALIFALGAIIGWALGTIKINAPIIRYFRDYYFRQAEARIRTHTNFLITQTRSFGAALDGHRRAATEAFDRGRQGFRFFSLLVYRARVRTRRKEGLPINRKSGFHL